jgi:membrane protein DedA with SNARE-associated domain
LSYREIILEYFLAYVFNFADNPYALFGVLFAGALLNTFFPPVPIEIGTVFAGYLVSQGHGSFWITVFGATLGMFTGSIILYHIARKYGAAIIRRPFFARLLNEKVLKRTELWLEKYGALSILITKFLPGMYFCAVVASGILSLKKPKLYTAFFFINLAAFAVHAYIGEKAGENWRHVYKALGKTGMFLLILIAVALALTYLAGRIFRKNYKKILKTPN